MAGIVSPEQIKIISIVMDSEKFSRPLIFAGSSKQTPVAVEFNIYENITQPFLTGSLVLQDDQDIYRIANLSGTERVTIRFEMPTSESEPIEKTFVVINVENSTKSNDYTSLLTLNLIEDIGFYNNIQKFSKAYDGTGEQIISSIITDRLKRTLDKTNSKQSFQSPFRYIVPFETPFDAIKTILQKMTTEFAMPYFFFSSLYSDQLILKDLETIISTDPFNKDNPFIYSQASTNSEKNNITARALSIHNYDGYNLENTLKLATNGGIGFRYKHINITTGQAQNSHVSIIETFNNLIKNNIIRKQYKSLLIDQEFIADPSGQDQSKLDQYDSRVYSEVSTDTFPYDTGLNGFSQEEFDFFNNLRVIRDAFLHNLFKNIYRLYVPGLLFTYKNQLTSVGSTIEVNVLRNEMLQPGMGVDSVIDQKRSGNFIILAKRHIFDITKDSHNVALEVSRLSNLENQL